MPKDEEPHQNAALGLDTAEQHGLQLGQPVQLLLKRGHHAEGCLAHGLQALSAQLRNCGAQAFWVLLRQQDRDI